MAIEIFSFPGILCYKVLRNAENLDLHGLTIHFWVKIMRFVHCLQINVARLFVSRTFGYWYTVTLGLSARCFPSVSSVNAVRVCTASCEGTPLFDYGNELCELRRWTAILVFNSVKHNYNTCLFSFLSGVPVHA